jgi:NAD(P)H-hydrate epimerase
VSASGTPALAAAGSGDLLSGIAATLVAQMEDAGDAAASAAWAHGRAAELARDGRSSRGVTLADVMAQMSRVWDRRLDERTTYPVLAELPAVGDPPADEA